MTARFRYRAAEADGRIVVGILNTTEPQVARQWLTTRGLFPLSIEAAGTAFRLGAVKGRADLAVFFRALASFSAAGMPLDRCLAACEDLVVARLRLLVREGRERLQEGKGLALALENTDLVPPSVLAALEAGERAGRLPEALEHVARQLEGEAELVSQIRQALAYPAVLALAGGCAILVIGGVVIPRIAALIVESGGDLPLASRVLFGLTGIWRRHWPLGVLGAAGVVASCIFIARSARLRERVEAFCLEAPVVGPLVHTIASGRVLRSIAVLLSAGAPLREALDTAQHATSERILAARLGRAGEHLAAGASLTEAFTKERVLSPPLLPLVAIGEESGQLVQMLGRAALAAESDAQRRIRGAVRLIEPSLILIFGAIVGLTAAALLQAVYALRPGLP